MTRSQMVAAAFALAAQGAGAWAQEDVQILLAPTERILTPLTDQGGRIDFGLRDFLVQPPATLLEIADGDRADGGLTRELAERVDTALRQALRVRPDFAGGTVLLSDGRTLRVQVNGAIMIVTPTGGEIGPIPGAGAPAVGAVNVVAVADRGSIPILNTGQPVPDPALETGIAACGTDTADPTTHCALFTLQLIHPDDHMFCTAVAVGDRHVLTAAHCLCAYEDDGILTDEIHGRFGSDAFFAPVWFEPEIAFFPGPSGPYCNSAITDVFASERVDLAVLTLADPDPDPGDGLTPLDRVEGRILQRGLDEGVDLDAGEVARLRAALGTAQGPEIWSADPIFGNTFATWGFGDGPDGIEGVRRAIVYDLQGLGPCSTGTTGPGCTGMQEALFDEVDDGLCAGDSGSGVFKPLEPLGEDVEGALAGYGAWALMGIVSGNASPALCLDGAGELLVDQLPRNVTRIDTQSVAAWLDQVTEGGVLRRPVRMTFDTELAGDP